MRRRLATRMPTIATHLSQRLWRRVSHVQLSVFWLMHTTLARW